MGDGRAPSPIWLTLSRFVHRELIVLGILSAAAAAGFLVTKASASAAHGLRVSDARAWYTRGVTLLAAGRAHEAVEALARARALDRDQRHYHLELSRALRAAGQPDASRQILLGLREVAPDDPQVNVALADLAAEGGHHEDAVRYYQSALYGAWAADQIESRTQLRRRVVEYLLAQGMQTRALSQLLPLEDAIGDDEGARVEIANLFLQAGDPGRALQHYRRVLSEARSPAAAAGAARAAFALGQFDAARRYLRQAPADDAALGEIREMTAAVLAADPMARGLSRAEQARRIANGAANLSRVLAACRADAGDTQVTAALDRHLAALDSLAQAPAGAPVAQQLETATAALADAALALPSGCRQIDASARAWRLIGRARQERLE
jgi:tetratricopeptide (TPR) repeat protein